MSVAKAYARALFEAGRDSKLTAQALDEIGQQLKSFAALMQQSKELRGAILTPALNSDEKANVVQAVTMKAGLQPLLSNFLVLMARKERMPLLDAVCEAYQEVSLEAQGGVLGRLVSADPMNDSDIKGLADAFSQKLGKKVAFQSSTEPGLLAGMKITVGGVTYDGTLKTQLQRLRDQLVLGAGEAH